MRRVIALLAVAAVSGCSLDRQGAPPLAGPSELGPAAPVNARPVPAYFFSPTAPREGDAIVFDGRASTDDGQIAAWTWSFGDGSTGSGAVVTKTYSLAGTYNVTLTVTDDRGLAATSTPSAVVVATSPPPVANFSFSPTTPTPGTFIDFNGTLSTAAPGRTIVSWEWDLGGGFTASGPTVRHMFSTAGTYTVVLRVTDNLGKTNVKSSTITVGP